MVQYNAPQLCLKTTKRKSKMYYFTAVLTPKTGRKPHLQR